MNDNRFAFQKEERKRLDLDFSSSHFGDSESELEFFFGSVGDFDRLLQKFSNGSLFESLGDVMKEVSLLARRDQHVYGSANEGRVGIGVSERIFESVLLLERLESGR